MPVSSNSPVPSPFAQAVASVAPAGTILPSAVYPSAAGGVTNSGEMVSSGWRGVRLYCNTTVIGGAGNVVLKVQTKDPTTGTFVDLPGAVTAAIVTNTETTLTVYPGLAETANVDISDPLGISWRVVITVSGNDVTLSVSGIYLS